jgi:hypothetical protein
MPKKRKNNEARSNLKFLKEFIYHLEVLTCSLDIFSDSALPEFLQVINKRLYNHLGLEEEKKILHSMLEKIYKPYIFTDRYQDRRDILKGFIYHIERSLEKYSHRWNHENTYEFLKDQKYNLFLLECKAELEFWKEFDR